MNYKFVNLNITAKKLFPFRYSFYTGIIKQFTPLTSVNVAVIYSPANNTIILFPLVSWNAAKNLDLDLTLQSFFATQQKSYRSQGTTIFLRGRFSF